MPFQRKVGNDSLLIYACIDRITGEEVPFLIQMLMDAGARNANIVQAYGKKNRPVFLCFIDVKENKKENVLNILAFQCKVTGWHIFSTTHEYLVTKDLNSELILRIGGIEHTITITYKVIENDAGWKMILLENDDACASYTRIQGSSHISYDDFKSMIINELRTNENKEVTYE
jgi:uncharacterized protein (DUF111 family)